METTQSIEIIERMFKESKRSLHNYSFYFILWSVILIPTGIIEYFIKDTPYFWVTWPIAGTLGSIIAAIQESKQSKSQGNSTAADRIFSYTWGAFGFALLFVIPFSVSKGIPPHFLILLIAGMATFISGGIAKFKPLVYGSIAMELIAVSSAFFIDYSIHPLLFSMALLLGYLIPGIMLRKQENG
jgi:hypothetical protein